MKNKLQVGDKLQFLNDHKGFISEISYKKNQIVTVTKITEIDNANNKIYFEINNLDRKEFGGWGYPKDDLYKKLPNFKQKIKFVKELI